MYQLQGRVGQLVDLKYGYERRLKRPLWQDCSQNHVLGTMHSFSAEFRLVGTFRQPVTAMHACLQNKLLRYNVPNDQADATEYNKAAIVFVPLDLIASLDAPEFTPEYWK